MATKQELVDAEMLARFAELKPEEVEEFRHSVAPGFVPEPWWDFDGQRMSDLKMWQEMQILVRETWDSGFSGDYVLSVLVTLASTESSDRVLYGLVRALPYQRATMFLFNQCWRARHCNRCRKRFVAKTPNDQFCSEDCRLEFRRQYKAAFIREKRQKQQGQRKAKRKKN